MNNWLFWVVCAILLLGGIVGFARGAVRIAVSFVLTIVMIIAVSILTPHVTNAILKLTPAESVIESQCNKMIKTAVTGEKTGSSGLSEEQVRSIMKGAGVTEETLNANGITVEDIVNGTVKGSDLAKIGISAEILKGHVTESQVEEVPEIEINRQLQIQLINDSSLPAVFKEMLISNNNNVVYEAIGAEKFSQYVIKYLARIIINFVSYLLVFLILMIIARAIVFALDFVTNLPVLGLVNRLGGVALGVGVSVLVIGFIFVIITLMAVTDFGAKIMEQINQNSFLTYLYDNNIIMNVMRKLKM